MITCDLSATNAMSILNLVISSESCKDIDAKKLSIELEVATMEHCQDKDDTKHKPFESFQPSGIILLTLLDYIPCYELSTLAAVSREWRTMASRSYHQRLDQPYRNNLSPDLRFHHPQSANPSIRQCIQGYEELRQRQATQGGPILFAKELHRHQGTTRLKIREEMNPPLPPGYCTPVYDVRTAQLLQRVPLERDLPAALLASPDTRFVSGLRLKGWLFLTFSVGWSVEYARTQQGLSDRCAQYLARYQELMDEYEGDEEAAEDKFYEEEEDLFGSDISLRDKPGSIFTKPGSDSIYHLSCTKPGLVSTKLGSCST